VFLGAGASATFGWPLTKDLLPLILDGLIEHDLFEDYRVNTSEDNAADRELLTKALRALWPGLQLTTEFLTANKHRLPLVTSLLSMLDFSLSSGQALVSGLSVDEIKSARTLLERAIYEAIEYEEDEVGEKDWPARQPKESTGQLIAWLDRLRARRNEIAVISSNYDMAIEKAWGFKGADADDVPIVENLSLDFGFDWLWPSNEDVPTIMYRPVAPQRRLFKLHGSTNWLRCGLCDRVYINPEIDIAVFAYDRTGSSDSKCHCGHPHLEVQIVSPSFVREVRAPNLISVWQRALNWLREADDWIIIGYSFPDEDLNIRSLFTRALASGPMPKVTAIQLGTNEQMKTRYEAFFPVGQLTFINCGLAEFLKHVQ
jgi:hypothetical protein